MFPLIIENEFLEKIEKQNFKLALKFGQDHHHQCALFIVDLEEKNDPFGETSITFKRRIPR